MSAQEARCAEKNSVSTSPTLLHADKRVRQASGAARHNLPVFGRSGRLERCMSGAARARRVRSRRGPRRRRRRVLRPRLLREQAADEAAHRLRRVSGSGGGEQRREKRGKQHAWQHLQGEKQRVRQDTTTPRAARHVPRHGRANSGSALKPTAESRGRARELHLCTPEVRQPKFAPPKPLVPEPAWFPGRLPSVLAHTYVAVKLKRPGTPVMGTSAVESAPPPPRRILRRARVASAK